MMLENELRGYAALFSALIMAIGNKFTSVRPRGAISTLFTVVIIVFIIVGGTAVIWYVVVQNPGGASTVTISSTYP
jgi:hypothetical protein